MREEENPVLMVEALSGSDEGSNNDFRGLW